MSIPANPDAWGTDRNCYLAVNSHPGLVNLFLFRFLKLRGASRVSSTSNRLRAKLLTFFHAVLNGPDVPVEAVVLQKLPVGAPLHDFAPVQHKDQVCVLNGRDPLGDASMTKRPADTFSAVPGRYYSLYQRIR